MCLAVADDGRVITGSKDHLISLVEANASGQSVSLAPPHYDGVQCLTTCDLTLFSGIYKWFLILINILNMHLKYF